METLITEIEGLTININSFVKSRVLNESVKPSFFNFYALIWFKKASGRYFLDFKEYKIKENSVIIISKNQDISFEFSESENQYVSITFRQEYLETFHQDTQKLLSFCIREHFEGKQILKVAEEDEKYLDVLVSQLNAVYRGWEGDLKKTSLFYLLQLFLIYCTELSKKQRSGEMDGYTDVVGNFTTMLEANFRKVQKVNFYTDNLNLTYNSLARYTTSYCSKTPKEIITERLILEIKRLLAAEKTPIKEIAYHLGFDEPTNMVKYFKKYTGITPSEFRKQK